jgi:hypothetical protein
MFRITAVGSVFLCVILVSCGQPAANTGSSQPNDIQGDLGDSSGLKDAPCDKCDTGPNDSGASDGGDDGSATDVVDDQLPGTDVDGGELGPDGAQTGCEFAAKPLSGEPGAPCKTSAECDSGACIEGANGKICTQSCSSCCPTGFACESYQTAGGDPVQMCLPKWNALCRPCDTDAECAKLGKDSLCVGYGSTGSFCGGACQDDKDCPGDYKCQDAQGEKGAGKQCVRTTGVCACSPQAIADGAQTTCKVTNASGTCSNVRKCALAGLSPCSATTPAPETCGNGVDENCDGKTDENGATGCTQLWADGDGDGDGKKGSSSQCQCATSGLYTATTATDCDDANKSINGKALEVCDGADNNCDGKIDEGCDDDGDGWCDAGMFVVGDPVVCKKGKKDCDDANASANPGMQELCGNGVDDDCDGLTDSGPNVSGCVPFYADNDGDGFGSGDPACQCGAKGLFSATKTGDCDDSDPKVSPGAKELCGDAKDDDCNGLTDEANGQGCTNFWVDLDGDGFGAATPTCLCAATASYTAMQDGDCNDSAIGINPAATETCNGADDNCNGTVDEMGASGCVLYYVDGDGDGFGNPATGLCLCGKTLLSSTATGGDCNDDSGAAHPGASEVCDGLDNDCDGLTDEQDAGGCKAWYADGDGDGWGDSTKSACLCAADAIFKVGKFGDCNDGNAAISPGAKEICDGVDNNCASGVDEAGSQGCSTFWRDHDGDAFGLTADSLCLCTAGDEYTAVKPGDCNDNDKAVNPKAVEACNGVDDDCDGVTDPLGADGCTAWYLDKDADNYGTFGAASKCLCVGIPGYANLGGDCNDLDAAVHPFALEVCNGKDDDCDGVKDPKNTSGCVAYYVDLDTDAYGVSGFSQCLCAADGLFAATQSGDCNDTNPQVNPGMTELCNGVDDNCNSQTDEGLTATYYTDGDSDGFGVNVSGVVLCGPDATHKVTIGGDCDDTKSGINPGAPETCNSIDDNCNSLTDDGLPTTAYYVDGDNDGYGAGAGVVQCGPMNNHTVTTTGDCNDASIAINPGKVEVCNGIDDNCSGGPDDGLPTTTYFRDTDLDGYGLTASGVVQCGPLGGLTVTINGDCNDAVAAINPGASETCNGIDDNCNTSADEGLPTVTYYADLDADLYGNPNSPLTYCNQPAGYVVNNFDCNDSSAAINPNASEACGDNIDNNCDGQTDEGCIPCVAGTVLENFDDGVAAAWTMDSGKPGWHLYTPAMNGAYSLEFSDFASGGHGYTPPSLSTLTANASAILTVPAGTKTITMKLAFYPITKCFIGGFFGCNTETDTSANLQITVDGVTQTFKGGTYANGLSVLKFTLAGTPQVATAMAFNIKFSTSNIDYSTPAGFIGIDDIQTGCN